MSRPPPSARNPVGLWLMAVLWVGGGCDRERDLAYLPSLSASTDQGTPTLPESIAGIPIDELARVVDERPTGAAALGMGTTGGGTLADALANGAWVEVATAAELIDAVSGDAPRIVLIDPGVYDLSEAEATELEMCRLTCPAGSSLASELQPAGKCDSEGELETAASHTRRLRVGSNKTVVGLGAGATLRNVQVDVSGSNNVILRNLEVTQVSPGLVGVANSVSLWPSRYVWIDHCSFSDGSHIFINVASSWDSEAANYPIIESAGYITISYNSFDGASVDNCAGQQTWGVGTQRDPALTLHHNLMQRTARGFYLFGPETWGHVYNNVMRDTESYALAAACGAVGIVEANFFERTTLSLRIGDEGPPTWPFCATGLFGKAWYPNGNAADVANNVFDANSPFDAAGQALDGSTVLAPETNGDQRRALLPPNGDESYTYQLEPASAAWADSLAQAVGVGRLF